MKPYCTLWAGAGAAAAAAVLGCAGTENSIEEGEPIPNTSITSCGDALIQSAPPTGTFEADLVVGEVETTFGGSMIWQASCPGEETETTAQVEFTMTTLRVLDDDAGYPGAEIGTTPTSFGTVLTCTGAAPGTTETGELPTTTVPHLGDLCAEFQAMPTGMPLFVHIELVGTAITCSNEEFPVLIRRKVGVGCPDT